MKKLPDLPCSDCGAPAGRRAMGRRRRVCFECSVKRSGAAALEMFMGAGDAYAKWQQSAGPRGRPRKTNSGE